MWKYVGVSFSGSSVFESHFVVCGIDFQIMTIVFKPQEKVTRDL